jgi:hypothetical protein
MASRKAWRLLHVTPHLGGGVGRALLSLAEGDVLRPQAAPRRTVVCLEPPEKTGVVPRLRELGVDVLSLSTPQALPSIASDHDVVQCETWNHPRMFAALASLRDTPLRMLFWCHVSGLHFPRLPPALWRQPHPVVLTAPCSLSSDEDGLKDGVARGQVHVISSAAGFERWPTPQARPARGPARLGYLGSLNLAKMHPRYAEWLAAAARPGCSVALLGDEVQPGWWSERCAQLGRPGLMQAQGYCQDVAQALSQWDAMLYLLNPFHYGTAEIALLEAMASGVVPVVGANPCESDVVTHGETGWVAHDPAELGEILARCDDDVPLRQRMATNASDWVRETFTLQRQATAFQRLHEALLDGPRQSVDWPALLGERPWQWFASTVPEPDAFVPGRSPVLPQGDAVHAHLENTKGSVHHFARCFPNDDTLQAWSQAVRATRHEACTP